MTAKLNWGAVGAAIRSAEATGTTVGVAGIAPTGERFGHNAGRRFHSAGQGAPSLPAEWPCPIAGEPRRKSMATAMCAGLRTSVNDRMS
jgi:hypothetical protein